MLQVKANEVPVTTYFGRWLWCWDPTDQWEGYIHLDCDAICDEDGFCILCGNPSPTVLPSHQGLKGHGLEA